MIVKLQTEYHLDFLSLKAGSSESALVKMSNCWKSHAEAQSLQLLKGPLTSNKIGLAVAVSKSSPVLER